MKAYNSYEIQSMSGKNEIGIIGLAVMGANLARNFASRSISTAVFNRTTEKTTAFIKEFGNDFLHGYEELHEFIAALARPRKIIIMVQAGAPVDQLLAQLTPLLEPEDIVIDCGNSFWKDTVRREQEFRTKNISFFGCGVSGGEEGALLGPSLMPGGAQKNYNEHLAPLFERIAASDFSGKPCLSYIGPDGAGHFVKMVHNGIEYAVMGILAETYDFLRKSQNLTAPQIADVFAELHAGKLESFLTEIIGAILRRKDDLASGYLIDKIRDTAGQKGTGKWTVADALERGVSVASIAAAVDARGLSGQKDLRETLAKTMNNMRSKEILAANSPDTKSLAAALYTALLSIYAQGYSLIKSASDAQKWQINLSEVSRIWQGGCIIRARILEFLTAALKKDPQNEHLFLLPEISQEVFAGLSSLRQLSIAAISAGVSTPVLSSTLNYLEVLFTSSGNANFIQGLRDFFGAHTFERTDRAGTFHVQWNEGE